MKRELGQYYTVGNPFSLDPFNKWASGAGLKSEVILEPFAGANNIIALLQDLNYAECFKSYDVVPNNNDVIYRDSLKDFPKGHKVCVTNPPWLAKNSATRRGLFFPNSQYDDIYKFALSKCLANCDYVAAIIPESFITANIFHDRLSCVISLACEMFNDTEAPACLALFKSEKTDDFEVYRNASRLGMYNNMEKSTPRILNDYKVEFNSDKGNLGLFAIDDTNRASIRFCDVKELKGYKVSDSCRSVIKIKVNGTIKIEALNKTLNNFREKTKDIFLTAFKGLRKDGMYRRRLDFGLARRIINAQSDKASELDYEKIIKEKWKENAGDVPRLLCRNDSNIIQRLKTYSYRFDESLDKVKKKILDDSMFANCFAKDPTKQTTHEQLACEYFEKYRNTLNNFRKLPQGGKNAIYLSSNGVFTKEKKVGKALDFYWVYGNKEFYASHKYTKTVAGRRIAHLTNKKTFFISLKTMIRKISIFL